MCKMDAIEKANDQYRAWIRAWKFREKLKMDENVENRKR